MSKMYVGYDGNYGSAEECDLVPFDSADLTEEQMELLDNDPEGFFLAISSGDLFWQKVTKERAMKLEELKGVISLTQWSINQAEKNRDLDEAIYNLKRIYGFLTDTELEEGN